MTNRVVVLASGTGTLLQSLIDDPVVSRYLVAVGSDVPEAQALVRARAADIATFVVPLQPFARRGTPERDLWDAQLTQAVAAFRPNLVVLAGFMKLFGKPFLDRFGGRIINSHPSLLPDFPGAHGVRDALAAGVKVTGCSLFWVDEGIDTGELIAQRPVPVSATDTEASLHERIKIAERQLLCETVARLAQENDHE